MTTANQDVSMPGARRGAVGRLRVRVIFLCVVAAILLVLVAAAGRLSVRQLATGTQDTMIRDAKISEETLEVLAATRDLRRFEKDVFLNAGDAHRQAEYLEKWQGTYSAITRRFDALDRLIASDDDHAIVRDVRASLAAYSAGFERVAAGSRSGELATPQAANVAMGRYNDAIRSIEATSNAIGHTSEARTRARAELVQAETERALRRLGLVISAALLALAGAIAVVLAALKSVTGEAAA